MMYPMFDSALLDGVCASDDRDGDLTGQVLIRSVSQFTGENTALVSYIVFDSSDNMSTASRSVVYTDYTPPRFALSEPLVFAPSSSVARPAMKRWEVPWKEYLRMCSSV